jgi:tRNA uridine 5-carboxymethylaminomethyl modification enzyme
MVGEERLARADEALTRRTFLPDRATRERFQEAFGFSIESPTPARNLLKRHDLLMESLVSFLPEVFADLTSDERRILENRVRYEGYVVRERESVERMKPHAARAIPDGFDYAALPGLSREIVEKCSHRRPRTVGEAARIPGVTPAAVAIISAYVARGGRVSA